jgi:hypothetical protein
MGDGFRRFLNIAANNVINLIVWDADTNENGGGFSVRKKVKYMHTCII